uniref:Olfactory receptor n=2 Tax=Petromyzon marinus TaxID=7757 RepID=A0AAJ7U8K6_PETMA|nr:olfactory receptor 1496-like isoform X1 [Petromyzon marinus]XP_032831148.1 olfactory receptor 1496-like isoform X1 [Petromyzon marinus]XP_032831149.1 olfactory receptor 1496-like isoform X1 [Petromyzon marinus]
MENGSSAFYLSTFQASYSVQMVIFGLCLLLYAITVVANLLVFVAVLVCPELHKPMYLFLGNMAVADIVACTSSVPKQLQILLTGDTKILYESCLVQIFSVHVFGNLESLILSVMAFDRYVAICHPLRYHTIVTAKKTLGVLVLIWVISTSACMILPLLVTRLNFSDDNRKIQGILCDHMGVVVLAESDIKVNNAYGTVQMVLLFLLPLIFISYSYLRIFIECRIKRSAEITKHGLNTLLTHFLALLIFFICTLGSIIIPRYFKDLKTPTVLNIRCFLQFGILAIPMSNALIYFFRTKELRKGIMKSCQHIFLLRTLFPKFFKDSSIS